MDNVTAVDSLQPAPPDSFISTTREALEERNRALEEARHALKRDYIGLDEAIDFIINAMRPWYLLPETIQRPIVIGLWGRTGVGKTSLVLRLVELLKLQSRFACDDLGKYTSGDRVNQSEDLGILEKFSALSNQSAVFLFDEIQTARSIGDAGPIDRPNLRDLWTFLDTGKLTRDTRMLESTIFSYRDRLGSMKYTLASRPADAPAALSLMDIGFNQWDLDFFARQLLTSAKWIEQEVLKDPAKFLAWAIESMQRRMATLAIADFSRSLVFVSGNLEIFGATHVVDPDHVPADALHAAASELSINDIKAELLRLFRPEQVARLGTSHTVFPGFTRAQFRQLIDVKLNALVQRTQKLFGLQLQFDHSVKEMVFDEGAIPSQGARPVLSLITDYLESQIPQWILGMRQADCTTLALNVHFDGSHDRLIAETDAAAAKPLRFESQPRMPQKAARKKLGDPTLRKIIAVHEAGHAVAGLTLLGMLPKHIHCSTIKPLYGGHVQFADLPVLTRPMVVQQAACLLAGMVAEEWVFGAEAVTNGSMQDLQLATNLVGDLVSQWAMGSHIGQSHLVVPDNLTTFKKTDDKERETILREAKASAQKALRQQRRLFAAVVEWMTTHSELPIEQLKKIVLNYFAADAKTRAKLAARKYPADYEKYNNKLTTFLNK